MRLSIALASSAVMFTVLAMASSADAKRPVKEQPDYKDVEKNIKTSSKKLEKGFSDAPDAVKSTTTAVNDVGKAVKAFSKGNAFEKATTGIAAAISVNKAVHKVQKVEKNLREGAEGVDKASKDLENGYAGIKNKPKFHKRSFDEAGRSLVNAGSELADGFLKVGDRVTDTVSNGVHEARNGVVDFTRNARDTVVSGTKETGKFVTNAANTVGNSVNGLSKTVKDTVVSGAEGTKKIAGSAAGTVGETFDGVAKTMTNAAYSVGNTAVRGVHGALNTVDSAVESTRKSLPPLGLRKRNLSAFLSRVASTGASVGQTAGSVLMKVPGAGTVKAAGGVVIGKGSSVVSKTAGVVTDGVKSAGSTVIAAGGVVIGKGSSVVSKTAGVVTGGVKSAGSTVISTANGALTVVKSKASNALTTGTNVINTVSTKAVNVVTDTAGAVKSSVFGSGGKTLADGGKQVVDNVAEKTVNSGKQVVDNVAEKTVTNGKQVVDNVAEKTVDNSKQVVDNVAEKTVDNGKQVVDEVTEEVAKKTTKDKVLLVGAGLTIGAGGVIAGNAIVKPGAKPLPETQKDPQIIAFESPADVAADTLPASPASVGPASVGVAAPAA